MEEMKKEMKKDLQKLVKIIRDELSQVSGGYRSDYPKAMMTGQQMERRTATINCGYTYTQGAEKEEIVRLFRQRANFIMEDQRFMNFCEGYDAISYVEEVKVSGTTQVQIRINY